MAQILVVDDEADGRDLVSRYLARKGHHTSCAEDGQAALQKLLVDHPDVLILDVRMPNVSGIDLLQIMRSYLRWHSLPVILVSAHATPEEIRQAREMGVSHVFRKAQFSLNELGHAVEDCLKQTPMH